MKYKQIKELYPELLEEQTCSVCGKRFYFTYKQLQHQVARLCANKARYVGCSKKCMMLLMNKSQEHKDKVKQTCLNRYGVDSYTKTQEFKDKAKQTCLVKYGVNNYLHTQDCKDKLENVRIQKRKNKPTRQINFQGLLNYLHTHSKATIEALETYFKAYDVQNVLAKYNLSKQELRYRLHKNIPLDKVFVCKTCGKKIVFSKTNGYGNFCSIKCANTLKNKSQEHKDKVKQTCLHRYGANTFLQTQEYKDKSKQTCLDKYGVDSYLQSKEYKLHVSEIQEKIYLSKKLNNTFLVSNDEDQAYNSLLTKFSKEDIIRQYKCDLYPYQCDFYIKSLDLYIEYNGYWTHGKEPYDNSNLEHIKQIEFWNKKANEVNFKGEKKDQYKSAIYTWTILDVKKLKCFKKNKLNYKIFWNIKEVEEWINNL